MWQDPKGDLDQFVKVTNTLQIESLILAEWNMNDFINVKDYGVYKYSPFNEGSRYYRLPVNYDSLDTGYFFRDSEKSYYTFGDFVDENDEPVLFQDEEQERLLYFDLEDCFNSFRPRSGINKSLWFRGKYIDNVKTARRPRYYMASRYDNFKYWNSYRRNIEWDLLPEGPSSKRGNLIEKGISRPIESGTAGYPIEDVSPFVVYEEPVPANRIVVKMQTNLADSTSEFNIRNVSDDLIQDPLQDRDYSSIPVRWKIEYLDELDNWITAISFNENSTRRDGSEIIKWDGHIELYYGVLVPEQYKDSFHLVDYISNVNKLPTKNNITGESYIVGASESESGTLYIWDATNQDWFSTNAEYGFSILEDDDTKRIGVCTKLSNPDYFFNIDNDVVYREILMIRGLRVSVESMESAETTFDLIEISPRLVADISQYTNEYSVSKTISNDSTGLPVGSLIPSNGNITITNFDGSFTENNLFRYSGDFSIQAIGKTPKIGSIVSQYLKPNIKIKLYESILNVNGHDKFIPIKTFYSEEFLPSSGGDSIISIPLRDFFFRVESLRAPSLLLTNSTLTSAVSVLLDSVGFSNYIFKGFDNIEEVKVNNNLYLSSIKDPVIPFFFVSPDLSVAQVLNDLAVSCQAAMYFDEYNNFVIMPKEFLLPENNDRQTDLVLYGQAENSNGSISALPNIMAISSSESKILNDGKIQYNIRYIQRDVSSFSQRLIPISDEYRNYGYLPVLLWEVGNNNQTKTINEESKEASGYALGAAPLNTDLDSVIPYVENNTIKKNIIDIGENVYWLPRFQGYLFANGEIIRYDAVEYFISGTGKRWITSNQEYQKYFSSLPFNGKIYPTGLLRIFVEPYYIEYDNAPQTNTLQQNVTYKNGSVKRHGRGQFKTRIVSHSAGLPNYWSSNSNVYGCKMDSSYLFSTTPTEKINYPEYTTGVVGQNKSLAEKSIRTGIIRNWLSQIYPTDDVIKDLKTTQKGTIQSSGLSFSGPPTFPDNIKKRDFITYVNKDFISPEKEEYVDRRAYIIRYEEGYSPYPLINGRYPQGTEPAIDNIELILEKPLGLNMFRLISDQRSRVGYSQSFIDSVIEEISNQEGVKFIEKDEVISIPQPIYNQDGSVNIPEKPEPYKHFGTRMRIIGGLKSNDEVQSPLNSTTYYNVEAISASDTINIDGGSAGIAVNLNKNTNNGYFFEICTLTQDNLERYEKTDRETGEVESVLHNILFYKIVKIGNEAVPVKLWGGLANIVVDEGTFIGMGRIGQEDIPTVYDLAVEFENIGGGTRRFYLYINGVQVTTVDDSDPLPQYSGAALFVRGSTQCLFENFYALNNLIAKNSGETVVKQVDAAFGKTKIDSSEALRKYALSGFINSSYLSEISAQKNPRFGIYFEEFGTIMRECAYFNIRYDQAYPALLAEIAPTFTQDKGYSVSGFYAGSYGAEFLVFNNSDSAISLDERTGNYLRIIGITFTQNTTEELTVDDFFRERADFSNPFVVNEEIISPIVSEKTFDNIKSSRQKYGKKEFSLNPTYIQSIDDANEMMQWLVNKTLKERRVITINAFGVPQIQLGDIVTINYDMPEGNSFVDKNQQFVVKSIDFSRAQNNKNTLLTLVEI